MSKGINWDGIMGDAEQKTNQELSQQMSQLTKLDTSQIEAIINESGINQQDFQKLIEVMKSATDSNDAKAKAIANIQGGVNALIGIAQKFI